MGVPQSRDYQIPLLVLILVVFFFFEEHLRIAESLILLEPQSRFGDKPVKFQVVCPQNETAVLKELRLLFFRSKNSFWATYRVPRDRQTSSSDEPQKIAPALPVSPHATHVLG